MRALVLLAALLLLLGVKAQSPCDGLNASFTWNATTATGNVVQFINGTTGTGLETVWQWIFGDGTTSNAAQPLHEFPGPGTYTVCLVATTYFITNAGTAVTCVDEFCSTVTVAGANNCSWLNAGFTWGAGSTGVEFHYQPSGPAATQYTYQWSFGDGAMAATQNAFHTYASAGTYEVCLTVVAYQSNTSAPCTATSCQTVTWAGGNGGGPCDGLNASFTWNATTATGNVVQFINGTTGTGQETVWQWIFGDGTTSSTAQPLHEFPGPGTYTVCLVATTYFITNAGTAVTCVDEFCSTVTVAGANNCSWLNAGFIWGAGSNGVEFNYQPPTLGAQYAYQWSFGDGATAATQNAFHAYASAGTYEVCLTVVAYQSNSSAPCTATSCQMVQWSGGNGTACDGLNAAFSWNAATATGGVQFSNGTTGMGQQTTWSWNFGDGTTSTEPQPLHVFPGPGTYEVCLTAISIFLAPNSPALTCVDETCTIVTVGGGANVCDGLNASFTWNATTATGNVVQFINGTTGTGQETVWQWSFGDGTTSNAAQPLHEFPGPGTYTVCLVATTYFITNAGAATTCVDDHCIAVTIAGEPQECDPSFALEIESAPSNAGFSLTASTNLPNQGITWTFANGLVLYGPSIQVGLSSVLNIELCITAWYQPANSTDTCWTEVCGLLSELGFAVGMEEDHRANVSLWPNPASDVLFVEAGHGAPLSIAIHGADGRLERQLSTTNSPARIDMNGLSAGLKTVTVRAGATERHFRLVKD